METNDLSFVERQEIVSRAIQKLDEAIAEGWTYNWFAMWDEDVKECCLGGAYDRKRYEGESVADWLSLQSLVTLKEEPKLSSRDWNGTKERLCKKWHLPELV